MFEIFSWVVPLAVFLAFGFQFASRYRSLREQGRPIRPIVPPDALFGEVRASGCSESNLLSKLSGASNILLVSITRSELAVQSGFPLNLLMPQNSFEFRAPIERISSAYEVDTNSVRVSFTDEQGGARVFRLYLQNTEKFISVMSSLGVPGKPALQEGRKRFSDAM